MIKILNEQNSEFPFKWANLESYRESDAFRAEIYLKDSKDSVEDLIFLFYSLFGKRKEKLVVYNKSWWDFCLDTWDFINDTHDYEMEGKSKETQKYLTLLKESKIPLAYSGCCFCGDWNQFLHIILSCITTHIAPYSPLICDLENKFFLYFHHTGSIGIYYKEENTEVKSILFTAREEYSVEI